MLASFLCLVALHAQTTAVWLEDLDLSHMTQDWGKPQARKSVGQTPLTVAKVEYTHGVGTHANSELLVRLNGGTAGFTADVGIDDETQGRGQARFEVWGDGKRLATSHLLKGGQPAEHMDVPLKGVKVADLVVASVGSNDYAHADWGNAQFELAGDHSAQPSAFSRPVEPPMPIYQGYDPRPEINGPRVVGCSPGKPFVFKIPVSGDKPMAYRIDRVPSGLSLDAQTGILSGAVAAGGDYRMRVTVSNARGKAERAFEILCGDHTLARTPPMGWNSWNVWGPSVTAERVWLAADAFVHQNLIDYGFRYVNIDDAWEGARDANGEIQTNSKFPDIAALATYVHSKGLCLGIYSSPGPKTCGGYTASYQHEQQDADTYAKWGVDYLKYDWCSYGGIAPPNPTIADYQAPYVLMRQCLDHCSRDIVFSLCQYGMGDVWNWGKKVGGNLWRTTGDINDSWGSLSSIAFSQSDHASGAGPGGWNDPDMLVVGKLGWGDNIHQTGLTPNEQITHITMWSLLAAPLLLGCDLTKLDPWTKALMTNHDVLDVDQDPLGKPATRRFSTEDGVEVWSRPLWDGTTAVGFMNRAPQAQKITATWAQLGLAGRQPVRDLWLRKNLGDRSGELSAEVPSHGAKLFRIGRMKA